MILILLHVQSYEADTKSTRFTEERGSEKPHNLPEVRGVILGMDREGDMIRAEFQEPICKVIILDSYSWNASVYFGSVLGTGDTACKFNR